jgi:hypothetical protein
MGETKDACRILVVIPLGRPRKRKDVIKMYLRETGGDAIGSGLCPLAGLGFFYREYKIHTKFWPGTSREEAT